MLHNRAGFFWVLFTLSTIVFFDSGLFAYCKDDGKITEMNYQRIKIGMPKATVYKILGKPRDISNDSTQFPFVRFFTGILEASIWSNNEIRIIITFDNNKVDWKKLDKAE